MQHKTKSNTFREKQVRTVSGTKKVYTRRKPKMGSCPETGETLKGVPRALPGKMKNMSKSQKRPSRPFGGVLSSRATRTRLKNKARSTKL